MSSSSSSAYPAPHEYPSLAPLRHMATNLGAELVVTYLIPSADFDISIVSSIPVELKLVVDRAERLLVVVALAGQRDKCFYLMGVVSLVDLVTSDGMPWPPTASSDGLIRATVPRQSCRLDARALPVTLAAVYDSDFTYAPHVRFTIDDAKNMMAARMAQYTEPTDACLLLTERDRQMDRVSYDLARCAIAAYMPRGVNEGLSGTVRAWLKGEMRIARYRMRVRHVPDLLASHGWKTLRIEGTGVDPHCAQCKNAGRVHTSTQQRCDDPIHHWGYNVFNGCGGVDCLAVPELSALWQASHYGALVGGRFLTKPALYVRHALLMQEKAHLLQLASAPLGIEDRDEMLLQFYVKMQGMREQVRLLSSGLEPLKRKMHRKYARRPQIPVEMEGVESILPIDGWGDLQKVMPGCMRDMADTAFSLKNDGHLKSADRTAFFHFLLVQQFDQDLLMRMLDTKLRSTNPNYQADGGAIKQLANVENVARSVGSGKYGYMYSCKRLMADGKCPFFRGDASRARVECHSNQLMLARITYEQDPDGAKWSIGFPVRFSQKVKRLLANAPAAPVDKSKIDSHFAPASSSSPPLDEPLGEPLSDSAVLAWYATHKGTTLADVRARASAQIQAAAAAAAAASSL